MRNTRWIANGRKRTNILCLVGCRLYYKSTLETDNNPSCYRAIEGHRIKNNTYRKSSMFQVSYTTFILFLPSKFPLLLPSFWFLSNEKKPQQKQQKRERAASARCLVGPGMRMSGRHKQNGGQLELDKVILKLFSMLHELLLALSGNCGGVFIKKGKNNLQVSWKNIWFLVKSQNRSAIDARRRETFILFLQLFFNCRLQRTYHSSMTAK